MSLSTALHLPKQAPPIARPGQRPLKIAVVGGGIAGLAAAAALKARGYRDVTVFEKASEVGGKVRSRWIGGEVYELGALIANHDFRTVKAFARFEHLSSTPLPNPTLIDEGGHACNERRLACQRFGTWNVIAAVVRFLTVYQSYARLRQPGFGGMDRRLFAPMATFVAEHRLEAAAEMVRPFLTGCGYGYYETTPAMYLMKLAPWVLLQPVTTALTLGHSMPWSTFDSGWQELCRRLAVGLTVRTSTPVTHIVRAEGVAPIRVTAGGREERCDRVILALPLDDALGVIDASAAERALFSRIRHVRYLTTVVEGRGIKPVSYGDHLTPDTIGHLNYVVEAHPGRPIYQLYQMLPDGMGKGEALALARHDLQRIGGRITRLVAQKEWRYFPHVPTADLLDGYYDNLENLQGQRGTYYVGGLLSFETAEHAAAYSTTLVARSFPKV